MLKYTTFGFFEGLNAVLALSDEFGDRQREPVMVLLTLVHQRIQLLDVLFKKTNLDRSQVLQRRVVASEQLVKFVDVTHVVLLLQGDVDDRVRDFLADTV